MSLWILATACKTANAIPTLTATPSEIPSIRAEQGTVSLDETKSACIQAITDLHVRAEPSETAAVRSILMAGKTAQVVGTVGEWTQIIGGYVRTKYTEKCQ